MIHFIFLVIALARPAFGDVWIWPGAYRTQSAKVADQSVLVLQKHFDRNGRATSRGPSAWPWPVKELTLVFRFESRPQADQVVREYVQLKRAWESHGVHVAGLQLDYDSPTAKLAHYRNDLAKVLKGLPKDSHLSVTGLADWLQLREFDFNKNITVYFQLYRGAREHAVYEMNLSELSRARYPFKIGILPNQVLPEKLESALNRNSRFKGFAQFYGGTRL